MVRSMDGDSPELVVKTRPNDLGENHPRPAGLGVLLEGGPGGLAPHRLVHQSSWDAPFGSVWVSPEGSLGGNCCRWDRGLLGFCMWAMYTPTPGGNPRVGFTFTCSRQPHSPPELLTDRLPDLCQDSRFEGVRQAVPIGHDLGQVLGKPVLFWYSSWVWESVLLVSRCVRVVRRRLVLRYPSTSLLCGFCIGSVRFL